MGVESMSDPSLFGQRMAQDPQTLEFVAGFLKAPVNPMAMAIMQLRESMLEMNDDAVGEAEATKSELLIRLAAKGDSLIEFTAEDVEFVAGHRMGWFFDQRSWSMVAKFSESQTTYLFSGKVKRHSTGRKCNGLIVVVIGNGSIQDNSFDTTDRDVIRAASACYRKNGVWPRAWQLENEDYLKKSLE